MVIVYVSLFGAVLIMLSRWANARYVGSIDGSSNHAADNKYRLPFMRSNYAKGYLGGVRYAGYEAGTSYSPRYYNVHTPGSAAADAYNTAFEKGKAAELKRRNNSEKNAAKL